MILREAKSHVQSLQEAIYRAQQSRRKPNMTDSLCRKSVNWRTRLHHVFLISVIAPIKPTVHQIIEGNDLHVTCSAEQTEGVEVYWVKNETNSEFYQNGTVLEFSKIHRSATGDYVCYRLNLTAGGNATSEKVISVDVLCKFYTTTTTTTTTTTNNNNNAPSHVFLFFPFIFCMTGLIS